MTQITPASRDAGAKKRIFRPQTPGVGTLEGSGIPPMDFLYHSSPRCRRSLRRRAGTRLTIRRIPMTSKEFRYNPINHRDRPLPPLRRARVCLRRILPALFVPVAIFPALLLSQTAAHPFASDSTLHRPPPCRTGWSSSSSRDPEGDFTLSTSGAFSPPGCALGSNAVLRQSLTTPSLDLDGWSGCSLGWMERRSSTHDASITVEASTDGGAIFIPVEGGVLPPPAVTTYVERRVTLPQWLEGRSAVRLRWTVAGDGTGATGTIRLDDVSLAGRPRHDLYLPGLSVSPPAPAAGRGGPLFGIRGELRATADATDARLSWAYRPRRRRHGR